MTSKFRELLMEGLRHFASAGYTSEAELQEWIGRLHVALEAEVPSDQDVRLMLDRVLEVVYARDLRGGIAKRIPGISRYTIDRVAPHLRAELDRRIFAGIDLIKLNRRAAVEKTLQRFSGWISSVPAAGSSESNLRKVATEIAKPSATVKYQARRVAIDQGHKLSAAVAHVVAQGEGAIAAIWHDRGKYDGGYDARPEHLRRSGKLFLIRGSWAIEKGLIRKGSEPYTDEIEQPAELPFCSCWYEYITTPRRLPQSVLTEKGKEWVSAPARR